MTPIELQTLKKIYHQNEYLILWMWLCVIVLIVASVFILNAPLWGYLLLGVFWLFWGYMAFDALYEYVQKSNLHSSSSSA